MVADFTLPTSLVGTNAWCIQHSPHDLPPPQWLLVGRVSFRFVMGDVDVWAQNGITSTSEPILPHWRCLPLVTLTTSCSFPQHAAIVPTICFFSQLASMLYTTNIQTRLKPCSCKKASKDSCEGLQIPYIGRNTSHALWFGQSSTFQSKARLQVGFDECWSPAI